MNLHDIENKIQHAANHLATTWPLYSFVTSNPLKGYEYLPFGEAVTKIHRLSGTSVFPSATAFKKAWERGDIKDQILRTLLQDQGYSKSPEQCLEILANDNLVVKPNTYHKTDRLMAKWLSAFMDEGLAEWSMPYRDSGFYKSWKLLAPYDIEIPEEYSLSDLPENPVAAIQQVLEGVNPNDLDDIFAFHLQALPGWTGYIKNRIENNTDWQRAYPITLTDYLAVRLILVDLTEVPLLPDGKDIAASENEAMELAQIWLEAWEKSWQSELAYNLNESIKDAQHLDSSPRPDAQLVFCIDTRSERIRRHIEAQSRYETFGYAGFFGIPMQYRGYQQESKYASCPPIVKPQFMAIEKNEGDKKENKAEYDEHQKIKNGLKSTFKALKNSLPSAFGFVEGAGLLYGFATVLKTLWPAYGDRGNTPKTYEKFCEPELVLHNGEEHQLEEISTATKADLVKTAFNMMGWDNFARLVIFVGHESQTANNPFASSLDCGACAGNGGRHNARLLAKMANDSRVRIILNEEYGYNIPSDTLFIGGAHNTTTDEIILFDEHLPDTHTSELVQLKKDLLAAQSATAAERLDVDDEPSNIMDLAAKKSTNWSETRPEWGLAGNAGFIIAPRRLTQNINLDGECFLHSYDWKKDEDGSALEAIMQGPMTVTQWINTHYYFSLVDNDEFGSGSKITHNVASTYGVVQGNGGDLKRGLPLQSLMQSDRDDKFVHQPLRLTTFIHAPLERVASIIGRNEDSIQKLLDNRWMYLKVICPERDHSVFTYQNNMEWDCEHTKERICKDNAQLVT